MTGNRRGDSWVAGGNRRRRTSAPNIEHSTFNIEHPSADRRFIRNAACSGFVITHHTSHLTHSPHRGCLTLDASRRTCEFTPYPMKRLILAIGLLFAAAPWLNAQKLSSDELKRAADHLKKTNAALIAATNGLSPAQWNFKP